MVTLITAEYLSDYEALMSHRHDNGADYWTTPDNRLIKGSPFSTLECVHYLLELGMDATDPILTACADLIFSAWRQEGFFKVYPSGSVYPCHTVNAVATLCHMGYEKDPRVLRTFEHLLETQYADGGWRCNKFSFGRGPETEFSNPLPTLIALDAFRFTDDFNKEPLLDKAVEFLLSHWETRKPLGPCHYGIGKLFMEVEYPFRNYNLFMYVYILSFYDYAKKDHRFLEALKALEANLTEGQIVVRRVVPKLAKLKFCKKNASSEKATVRYKEILANLEKP